MQVVLDTNIIISAAISGKGNPAKIMKMVSEGKLQMCYNTEILSEYSDVLFREKFSLPIEKQNALIRKIIEMGTVTNAPISTATMTDESDRIFYDTAKDIGAVLITGNIKHYPVEDFIVTPAMFLATWDDKLC